MHKYLTVFLCCLMACTLPARAQKGVLKVPATVAVAGGTFSMGSEEGNADEKPVHPVTLSGFSIGVYEISFAEFSQFIDSTKYVTDAEQPDSVRAKKGMPPAGPKQGTWSRYANGLPIAEDDSLLPVGNVSWHDAIAYCKWLSLKTGKTWRLPTEAEWEYAARGGNKSGGYRYAGGNDLDRVAWYLEDSHNRPHMRGKKLPNELGLYDMTGNNREWCSDWYAVSYATSGRNPAGPAKGDRKVVRGGSWTGFEEYMRVTRRTSEDPHMHSLDIGFRVVLETPPSK